MAMKSKDNKSSSSLLELSISWSVMNSDDTVPSGSIGTRLSANGLLGELFLIVLPAELSNLEETENCGEDFLFFCCYSNFEQTSRFSVSFFFLIYAAWYFNRVLATFIFFSRKSRNTIDLSYCLAYCGIPSFWSRTLLPAIFGFDGGEEGQSSALRSKGIFG